MGDSEKIVPFSEVKRRWMKNPEFVEAYEKCKSCEEILLEKAKDICENEDKWSMHIIFIHEDRGMIYDYSDPMMVAFPWGALERKLFRKSYLCQVVRQLNERVNPSPVLPTTPPERAR